MCMVVVILSVVLSLWIIHENKQLAKEGIPEVVEFEETSAEARDAKQVKHRNVW